MYLFARKGFFLRIFYLTVIIGFISISYKTSKRLENFISNQIKLISSIANKYPTAVFIPLSEWTSTDQKSNIPFDNGNKCVDRNGSPRRSLSHVIRYDSTFNYLSFILRSHSLFYCSVPKVATRTLLLFLTYLHIRDDLIPLMMNNSKSNFFNISYFTKMNSSSTQNTSQPMIHNPVSLLQLFLSQLLLVNSSKIDLWSMYQDKVFPLIRLRTLPNPSIIFSPKYLRVLFVRHPFERLASAYIDKISSLKNEPFSLYDYIRRAICRKYSLFYLTEDQRALYRTRKSLAKKRNEPCEKIQPKFEHFIEYIMADSRNDDVHWKPYSSLCHVCLFKYNFIGKFETIEEDLEKILKYLGLKSNDWVRDNYFQNGKNKENYQLMYSNLTEKLICDLKYFYKYDFKLFHYRIEDYLIQNRTIQCSSKHIRK